jgi:hypothetical protein
MAANHPVVDEIIADCKRNMQLFCDTYNHLFEIGSSYVKTDTPDVKIEDAVDDEDKLFFLGEHILLGCKHSRSYLITAKSKQSNTPPSIVTIEQGGFSITTYGSSNGHYSTDTIIVDGPLKIAVKINDKYHFVGLAVVGAENKIGVFSIIKDLSNDKLKNELLGAVKDGSHMLCFENENSFFNDGKFKPGISINKRKHAAKEIELLEKEINGLKEEITRLELEEKIRRLEEPCISKKHQLRAQEIIDDIKETRRKAKAQEIIDDIKETQRMAEKRINDIQEALKKNSPENLHTLLKKNSLSFCAFSFSLGKSKRNEEEEPKLDKFNEKPCQQNMVYRSLSKKA